MTRLLAVLVVACVHLPTLAGAARLNVQVRGGGGYTDNVNNSAVQVQSDILGSVGLNLALESERNVPFTWRLNYGGRYNFHRDVTTRDGYSQVLEGEFQTPLNPTTRLVGGIVARQTFDLGADEATQLRGTRRNDRIDRANLRLGLDHRFGSRWSGNFNVSYRETRYNSLGRADSSALGGVANLSYAFSQRQNLGVGLSVTRRRIEGTRLSSEQDTDFANAFVSWSYLMSPRWSLSSRIGPTYINAEERDAPVERLEQPIPRVPLLIVGGVARLIDATSCPTVSAESPPNDIGHFLTGNCRTLDGQSPTDNPPVPTRILTNPGAFETNNDSFTTFASISLVRQGDLNSWTTSLNRTDGGNLGGLTSTVATTLSSTFRWKPAEKWDLSLSGFYVRRESATESTQIVDVFVPNDPDGQDGPLPPFDDTLDPDAAVRSLFADGSGERRVVKLDNAVDIDTWSLRFQATRTITRKLSAVMDLGYVDQENKSQALASASSFDAWRLNLSFVYQFEPIAF